MSSGRTGYSDIEQEIRWDQVSHTFQDGLGSKSRNYFVPFLLADTIIMLIFTRIAAQSDLKVHSVNAEFIHFPLL